MSTQLFETELRPDTDPMPEVADPEALEMLDTQLAALLSQPPLLVAKGNNELRISANAFWR